MMSSGTCQSNFQTLVSPICWHTLNQRECRLVFPSCLLTFRPAHLNMDKDSGGDGEAEGGGGSSKTRETAENLGEIFSRLSMSNLDYHSHCNYQGAGWCWGQTVNHPQKWKSPRFKLRVLGICKQLCCKQATCFNHPLPHFNEVRRLSKPKECFQNRHSSMKSSRA